jgi:hypothetical protein
MFCGNRGQSHPDDSKSCSACGISFYSIVAYPVSPTESGVRIFCSDQTGIIRYEPGGSAETCGESSPPLK